MIPSWLKKQADTWVQHPQVDSVMLFGSRAMACAAEYSDWDIAILYEGNPYFDLAKDRETRDHMIDLAWVSVDTFKTESFHIGSLSHELAHHAEVIAGTPPVVGEEGVKMSEDALERHLEYGFKELARAIREVQTAWEYNESPANFDGIPSLDSSKASGDAAERIVKALCVYLGVTYKHTYDVKTLADMVPRRWRSKVLSVNGNTKRTHTAHYTGDEENLEDVTKRLDSCLNLLDEILGPCLEKLSSPKVEELKTKLELSPDLEGMRDLLDRQGAHSEVVDLTERVVGYLDRIEDRLHALQKGKGHS